MIWRELDETHSYDSYCHCVLDVVEKLDVHSMAEVGVLRGRLSRFLLSRRDLTYYLIDPWAVPPESAGYRGAWAHQSQERWDELYEEILDTFALYPKAEVVRLPSVEAAERFADDSLDLVFVDANHSYESVREDITAWSPKARYVTGHDYGLGSFKGVRKAVDEMFPTVYHGRPVHKWGWVFVVDTLEGQ